MMKYIFVCVLLFTFPLIAQSSVPTPNKGAVTAEIISAGTEKKNVSETTIPVSVDSTTPTTTTTTTPTTPTTPVSEEAETKNIDLNEEAENEIKKHESFPLPSMNMEEHTEDEDEDEERFDDNEPNSFLHHHSSLPELLFEPRRALMPEPHNNRFAQGLIGGLLNSLFQSHSLSLPQQMEIQRISPPIHLLSLEPPQQYPFHHEFNSFNTPFIHPVHSFPVNYFPHPFLHPSFQMHSPLHPFHPFHPFFHPLQMHHASPFHFFPMHHPELPSPIQHQNLFQHLFQQDQNPFLHPHVQEEETKKGFPFQISDLIHDLEDSNLMTLNLEKKNGFYVVTGKFPGLKKDDLKITLDGSHLTLKGKFTKEDKPQQNEENKKPLGLMSQLEEIEETLDLPYSPEPKFFKAHFDEEKHSFVAVFPEPHATEISLS